jgi:ribosomal protein S27AE
LKVNYEHFDFPLTSINEKVKHWYQLKSRGVRNHGNSCKDCAASAAMSAVLHSSLSRKDYTEM